MLLHADIQRQPLQDELDLLPRLPPADFFAWASDIPHSDGSAANLPSVSELVRNRGSLPAASLVAQTACTTNGGNTSKSPGHDCKSGVRWSGVRSAGVAVETGQPKSLSMLSCKARGAARSDWETNQAGQVSTEAATVLHECRQAHGGHAVWTSYLCVSSC